MTSARALIERAQRWWGRLPLRNRLTAAAAAAAAVALLGVSGGGYIAVRHVLLSQIDSQLRHQVPHVTVEYDPSRGVFVAHEQYAVGDIGGKVQAIDALGDHEAGSGLPVNARDIQIAQTGHGQQIRTVSVDGRPYRMLTEPVPGSPYNAVQIALPLSQVDHQLAVLTGFFIIATLVGLGLVAGGSWLVVRRTMRPVMALTQAAERITVTRDLTTRIESFDDDELGRLAALFNAMLDALERSLQQQRQLVLDASHELRTPLASLRTNVELLNEIDAMTPEQRRATLQGIVAQLDELTVLVADVVELARGEAAPETHTELAFDELVERAVDRARRHWREVTFTLDTVPVTVRGVAMRLDRAVANLLDNAGKFSPPGSVVEVRLARDGDAAELSVADRGPGIPPEALPHVFDRFYRADPARALPGSGLGLAIVKQIVDGHRGRVALQPRADGGTVAVLRLPAVPAASPPSSPPPAAPAAPSSPAPVSSQHTSVTAGTGEAPYAAPSRPTHH